MQPDPTRRGRGSRTPTSRTITSTTRQSSQGETSRLRFDEDASLLLDEAGLRLVAIEQNVEAAMLDGTIDVALGAFVLDMSTKVRTFVEAATHRDLVGVS